MIPIAIRDPIFAQRSWRSCSADHSFRWLLARPPQLFLPTKAAAHVNGWATMEGVVAKVFTSKSGNTFLNIGATYPNQTFTGWIPPASPVSKSPLLTGIEGKHVKISGRIEMYQGKPEIRINAAE